jgi:transcriptional regulator of met regulon
VSLTAEGRTGAGHLTHRAGILIFIVGRLRKTCAHACGVPVTGTCGLPTEKTDETSLNKTSRHTQSPHQTHSVQQGHSRHAITSSASRKITRILWKSNVRRRIHNSVLLHAIPSYFICISVLSIYTPVIQVVPCLQSPSPTPCTHCLLPHA